MPALMPRDTGFIDAASTWMDTVVGVEAQRRGVTDRAQHLTPGALKILGPNCR
jgi:hypothetical protein